MALLESLPDELFVQILSNLPNRDLATTSRVSRRLSNISQPLLYGKPHLTTSEQHPSSFDLFFHRLLTPTCESLGSLTHCLTIDWKGHYTRGNNFNLPFHAAVRSRFALGDTTLSDVKLVSLLLQLLPRLQALHLPLPYVSPSCRFSPHHPYMMETLPLPPTLRRFTYEWYAPANWINIENLTSLLRLPRITSIATHVTLGQLLIGTPTALGAFAAAAGTSSLTHLTIPSGCSALQPLRCLLGIPRALTHFTYHPSGVDFDFNFAGFGLALLPLKHSLTSLVLDFRLVDLSWVNRPPITTIGSLRDWAALRSLTCSLPVLLASDSPGLAEVLPAGIRELEILDDLEPPVGEAVKAVVELLGAKELVLALERVGVYACRSKSKRLRKRLRKACWAVGVRFDDGCICVGSGCVNQ